jgi:hypothetical protein
MFTAWLDTEEGPKPPPKLSISGVKFLIVQEERCPTTQKRHLQGYVELERRTRMPKGVQKTVFGGDTTVDIRPRRGEQEEAIAYCSKPDSRVPGGFRYGTPCVFQQGKRTDLSAMLTEMQSALKEKEDPMAELMFGEHREVVAKYNRFAETALVKMQALDNKRKLRHPMNVIVIEGPPGTGKSKRVWELVHGHPYYKLDSSMVSSIGVPWFQNLTGNEKFLIIDDCVHLIRPSDLMGIGDIYPLRLNQKGGHAYAGWSCVFILTNFTVDEWYGPERCSAQTLAAIKRRITEQKKATVLGSLDGWIPNVSPDIRSLLNLDAEHQPPDVPIEFANSEIHLDPDDERTVAAVIEADE